RVALLHDVGGNVDLAAVDPHMTVVDELARLERRHRELHPVDHGVEPALEQLDEVLAGVAAPARGLGVDLAELPLGDVAVVALELLLGVELEAEIGRLAAARPVLAGSGLGVGRLAAAPEIDAEAARDLVLGLEAFGHSSGLPGGKNERRRRAPPGGDRLAEGRGSSLPRAGLSNSFPGPD